MSDSRGPCTTHENVFHELVLCPGILHMFSLPFLGWCSLAPERGAGSGPGSFYGGAGHGRFVSLAEIVGMPVVSLLVSSGGAGPGSPLSSNPFWPDSRSWLLGILGSRLPALALGLWFPALHAGSSVSCLIRLATLGIRWCAPLFR